MTPRIPVTTSNIVDWVRRCAVAVNTLLGQLDQRAVTPFTLSLAAPPDPVEGQTYYDLALHKPRYWNGSAWVDL